MYARVRAYVRLVGKCGFDENLCIYIILREMELKYYAYYFEGESGVSEITLNRGGCPGSS